VNVVDVAWGPGIAGIAVLSALAGRGEDPRYAEMLEGTGPLGRVVKVFVVQGAAQWFISLPIQVAASSGPPRGRLARVSVGAGTGLMVAGGLVEAIADRQKAAWKAKPGRGSVLEEGLWAASRHPNYFGDACMWWGIYLIAAAARPGGWTIPSPAAMTWLLTAVTGARRAERMRSGDSDYAAYQRRVPFFVPRPARLLHGPRH
jgi:steroid 5-alpha reductase family enzyme